MPNAAWRTRTFQHAQHKLYTIIDSLDFTQSPLYIRECKNSISFQQSSGHVWCHGYLSICQRINTYVSIYISNLCGQGEDVCEHVVVRAGDTKLINDCTSI